MRTSCFGALLAALAVTAGCAGGSQPVSAPRAPAPHGAAAVSVRPTAAALAAVPTPAPTRAPAPAGTPGPARPVAANPCEHNTAAKLVKVSLRAQHLWLCAATVVAYSAPITSGIVGQYTSTPTGTYRIQGITRNTTLTLNTGATYDVKYWIPFDGPLFGFHDSSWQDFPYGSAKYRTRGSHGCVHMPLAAIRFLAHWAQVGTKVTLR